MRRKILAANWKMHVTHTEAASYFDHLLSDLGEVDDVEIVLIPPFTSIPGLTELSEKHPFIRLGAQNLHWEKSGAFTGEISATMLRVLFVKYVVIGHSERRTLFGETDEIVQRKVRAAFGASLRPILCIGESLKQRDAGEVEMVLERQLRVALEGVSSKDLAETVIAYEPIWAIGTGRSASPRQAQEAHHHVRMILETLTDRATAEKVRIQYGGSVKPDSAAELMSQPDIDGALVGGASLEPRSFAQIIRCARRDQDEIRRG